MAGSRAYGVFARRASVVALTLLMCLALSLLSGCALQQSPAQVTSDALAALKAQDYIKLMSYYGGDLSDPKKEFFGNSKTLNMLLEGDDLSEEQKAIAQKLVNKACEFDYELGEEKIEGDKATVEVRITTYDFASLVNSAMKAALSKSLTHIFSSSSEEVEKKALAAAFDEVDRGLDELKDKTETATGTVHLEKQWNSWKIVSLDDDFYIAVLGGAISTH